MHYIIEQMEYLFPPLSYLTHHSALSGLLNLSQTLYLPGSHIHMSRSRYTYRPIQHSPPLFSLHVTRTPLSTIIPHSIIGSVWIHGLELVWASLESTNPKRSKQEG